jgi:hypothetical protein
MHEKNPKRGCDVYQAINRLRPRLPVDALQPVRLFWRLGRH